MSPLSAWTISEFVAASAWMIGPVPPLGAPGRPRGIDRPPPPNIVWSCCAACVASAFTSGRISIFAAVVSMSSALIRAPISSMAGCTA